ncbi:MAG: hypothetical protein ABI480_15090 [Chitinophagaceae bacterium]
MAKNFFTIKKILQYYLPLTLILFTVITIERSVLTDGGYDKLYGFPLPYISNGFAFSFHYSVFVMAMLFDLLVYFVLIALVFKFVMKLGLQLKTHWIFISFGIVVILFWVYSFILITSDSSFQLKTDKYYKTTSQRMFFGIEPL